MSKLLRVLQWLWCELLWGDDPEEDVTPVLIRTEEQDLH